MSLFKKKDALDLGAAADDRAVRKVYEYGSLALALTRIDTYWSFNKSVSHRIDEFVPFTHSIKPLRAFGVVDEVGFKDVHIRVEAEFVDSSDGQRIGHCHLVQKSDQRLLKVTFNDPDGSIGAAMANSIRDGAISGNSYQHFHMKVGAAADVASVARQIAEHGYGPSIEILNIDTIRRVILPKAPPETWNWG